MRKKVYGQSMISRCPFCNSQATIKNSQNIPVCRHHKNDVLEGLKCSCGEYIDIATGKYGPYFICMRCGNINFQKGLEMNGYPLTDVNDL